MGNLDNHAPLTPLRDGTDLHTQAMFLAPAVLRIVIAGKDIGAELDGLTRAVAILQDDGDAMRDLVYGMASELALTVEDKGMRGLVAEAKAALDPDTLAEAVRLGLAAIFVTDAGDDGDVGILSGIAESLGLSEEAFSTLYDSAKQAVGAT